MKDLPDRWEWKKLYPDVAEIIMGQSPPSLTYNVNEVGLPFFQGKADRIERGVDDGVLRVFRHVERPVAQLVGGLADQRRRT